MSSQRSAFVPRNGYPNFILQVIMTTAKMLFFVVLIAGVALTGLVMGVAKAWIDTTPRMESAEQVNDILSTVFNSQAQTSFIYDKNGDLITTFRGTENRVYCTYDELPQYLIDAVIAIEDSRFWAHSGVDVKRYIGALAYNLLKGSNQGGSTITCQLIKQTLLTSEQTYKRKIQEAYLALKLEEVLLEKYENSVVEAKQLILQEYMNVVYMGGSIYGVKTAAQDYFGKELSELTLKECAMIARLIKSPHRYNPRSNYYTRNTPAVSDDGAKIVLKEMLEQELITQAEYDAAVAEPLNVLETSMSSEKMYDNAYYVEYAIYDVVTKMLRVKGLEDTAANRSQMEGELRTGGYHIYTCLDPEMQQAVQQVITDWNQYPPMRYTSDQAYRTLNNGVYVDVVQPQAACAVLDWHTGELVAVVGGRAEPTAKKQLNRAYQMDMPVGSSIKPLSVYGPAFDKGWSPGTPVMNLPIRIEDWDSEQGYPTNFGGGGYTGCESMRDAINKSHNYSTAQALFTYVGISYSVSYLLKLGVSPKHIQATGSGLALGSSGISVIEMARAFGAIANRGEYLESYAFSKVLYNDNQTAYIDVNDVQIVNQAFNPSTAYLLVDVLMGCVSGANGTGSKAKFGNFTVAGKTGTNSDARGVCFAGMTAYYACAVWIGHDNYKPLVSNATGGAYAAPLWAAVMKRVHTNAGITRDQAIIPGTHADYGLVLADACGVSAMRPTDACRNDTQHPITRDYYVASSQPTVDCNMHGIVRICNRSNMLAGNYCNSTQLYSAIYIPQGHPLRQAETLSQVRQYFRGASLERDFSSIGTCTQCR